MRSRGLSGSAARAVLVDLDGAAVVAGLLDVLAGEEDVLVALHLDGGELAVGGRLSPGVARVGVDVLDQPAVELLGEVADLLAEPDGLLGRGAGLELRQARALAVELPLGLLQPVPLGDARLGLALRLVGRGAAAWNAGQRPQQEGAHGEPFQIPIARPSNASFTNRGKLPQGHRRDQAG